MKFEVYLMQLNGQMNNFTLSIQVYPSSKVFNRIKLYILLLYV